MYLRVSSQPRIFHFFLKYSTDVSYFTLLTVFTLPVVTGVRTLVTYRYRPHIEIYGLARGIHGDEIIISSLRSMSYFDTVSGYSVKVWIPLLDRNT